MLWIVNRNSQSIAASEMRSTCCQPSTSMSAVRLRCKDAERQRSPDGKHHEGLLAEHLRHVPVEQGTVHADVPHVALKTTPCIHWRHWRFLSSPLTRCRLDDHVPHATSTEGNNDHPPTSRAQHDEGRSAQDWSTRQRRLRHLANT